MDDLNHSFSLVWERVTGTPQEREMPERELTALMEEENAVLLALTGPARRIREMWEERCRSERRLRGLQAERFLLTGDTYPLSSAPPTPRPTLTALRELYLRASALSRRYADAGREEYSAGAKALAERAKRLLFLHGFGVRG